MATPRSARPRPARRRLNDDTAERISAGCYGALVAASTLVGAGDADLGHLALLVLLTNVIYYATHVFAYTIGDRGPADSSPWQAALHHLKVSAPIVSAAFAPLLFIVLLASLGVELQQAVLGGVLVALLFLAGVATTGAHLRRLHPIAVVLTAVLTVIISLALVLAKLSLH